MFESAGEMEPLINIIFLGATGYIALHGIRFRDEKGNSDKIGRAHV